MHRTLSRIVTPALLAGVLSGCAMMSYTQTEQVSLDDGYRATQAAMGDLEFTIKDKAKDALQARVEAEESDKTAVSVNMASKGERITEFKIKVGVLGDEAQARLIMDKIKKHF